MVMALKQYIYMCEKTENYDHWGLQNIQECNNINSQLDATKTGF